MSCFNGLKCSCFPPYFPFRPVFLQDGNSGVLPGATGPGLVPSGCSSLCCSVATAGSVHVRGLHKWERQGEQDLEQHLCESAHSPICLLLLSLVFLWQLHSWLAPTVENFSTMEPLHLSALSGLLPQLGAPFLLLLPSQLLLELLSQPGIHRYSPAQVSREVSSQAFPTEKRRRLLSYNL